MKRLLISSGMIVFVAAIAIGATGAFFSDTEISTGNTFTAGSLDLKVDSECHYFQDGIDVGCSGFGDWVQSDLEPGVHKFFDFGDIKPGDRGETTISLHVYDNDAWGKFSINETGNADNSCNEPEGEAELGGTPDVDGNPTPGCTEEGELASAMTTTVWLDEGSIPGFQNIGPDGEPVEPVQDETEGDNELQEGETVLGAGLPFFDADIDLATLIGNARIAANGLCANAPANGHVPGGEVPYGPCNGLSVDGRMASSTTYYIGWQWDLPSTVGNEVQTDSVSGDVVFMVEQHRNNPTPFE